MMKRSIGAAVGMVVALLLLAGCTAPTPTTTPSQPTTAPGVAPTATTAPKATGHTVRYLVKGVTTSITYSAPDGGQEQVARFTGDWDKVYTDVKPYTFLYVSAQNQNDAGDVSCTIFVDGTAVVTHTSTGAYVVVTCDLLK